MSKKADDFNKKLAEKLKENVDIVTSANSVSGEKFTENRNKFFTLLTDHPYFQKQVTKLRKKYSLPETGFSKSSDAFDWEHSSKKEYQSLVKDVNDFVLGFETPRVYRSSVWEYVYGFIVVPVRCKKLSVAQYPLFSVVQTDEDRDINKFLINQDSLYIEVFEWTTKRDLEKAAKILTKLKKEKYPLKVSRVQNFSREVWLLTEQGLSDKQIKLELSNHLKDKGNDRIIGYDEIPVYRKRYKTALSKLRKI